MASDRAAGSQAAPTPEAWNWGFDFKVVGTFYLISGRKYFGRSQDSTADQKEIPIKFLQFVYMATCPSPSREVAAAFQGSMTDSVVHTAGVALAVFAGSSPSSPHGEDFRFAEFLGPRQHSGNAGIDVEEIVREWLFSIEIEADAPVQVPLVCAEAVAASASSIAATRLAKAQARTTRKGLLIFHMRKSKRKSRASVNRKNGELSMEKHSRSYDQRSNF
jgi:hypothetical protein